MPQPPNDDPTSPLRTFLVIFGAFCLFLSAVASIHYFVEYRARKTSLLASEALNLDLARRMLARDLESVAGDLGFLREFLETQAFPAGGGFAEGPTAGVFLSFARHKGLYDQIRYLDAGGHERLRVNHAADGARLVPNGALQDKSDRYYVREAVHLPRGALYLSPFDLNVENGRLERPLKPMLRFATPVFDPAGQRRGLLVLNYLGQRLLDHFQAAAANIADHIQLLNAEGYWLSHPDPQRAWGFMLGRKLRFPGLHPGVWATIEQRRTGQITTAEGLFTFTTLDPARIAGAVGPGRAGGRGPRPWKIVAFLPAARLGPATGAFLRRNAPVYGALLLLLGLAAWLLARTQVRHRRAELARQYERRFRHTLEDIALAAVSLDRAGRVSFCNAYFQDLAGLPREEIVGRDWIRDFVPEGERPRLRELLDGLRKGEEIPHRIQVELRTARGGSRLMAWHITLTRDAEGRILGLTGIGEDITERRRSEEEVRKLSRAVEQSPVSVMITDRQGRIEYVNPKFTQVSGYALEEIRGQNPRILKSGESPESDYRDLWTTLEAGGEWRGVFHNRRKNGELYWEAASISALRDPEGRITHFLAVKEDITERRRLEAEVQARNRELARTQALAAMGRMASMVAHDLRNPLSSVKMALQIFSRQGTDGESLELARIALDQVRYMEDILTDMLSYSRPGDLVQEWLSLDKLLETSLHLVRRRLEELGAEVHLHCPPGLPTLPGDANKLHQVFSNLLVNAAQAVAGNLAGERRIEVRAALRLGAERTEVAVEVRDNGPGLPEGPAERLFEPFFTTRSQGTGLGLAIVRQIVERHRGAVTLDDLPGGGACARVILPTVPAAEAPAREARV